MASPDLDLALSTARSAAEAASRVALSYFGREVAIDLKPDLSPVTAADRASEAAIFDVIRNAFPLHTLLGEESGGHSPPLGQAAATRWIVDPLDGTRGFVRGESFWGPLVALEHEGEIVAGAMALPAFDEVYFAARGRGAWVSRNGSDPARLGVSDVRDWKDATFSMGEPRVLLTPPLLDAVTRLATSCARTRCHGDLGGFAMVLQGRAEAWLEAGVQVWDLAPMKILIEEAGGRFTDLAGRASIVTGNCIASNSFVHAHVLGEISARRGHDS